MCQNGHFILHQAENSVASLIYANPKFNSDAEISELLSNNKFRSEDDSFDIVPEKVCTVNF